MKHHECLNFKDKKLFYYLILLVSVSISAIVLNLTGEDAIITADSDVPI